jgi:hypothetical protein
VSDKPLACVECGVPVATPMISTVHRDGCSWKTLQPKPATARCQICGHPAHGEWVCPGCLMGCDKPKPATASEVRFADRVKRVRDETGLGLLECADRVRRMRELHIIFDGPPSHESGRFIEVEDENGRGVNAGEWRKRNDGLWELVIRVGRL